MRPDRTFNGLGSRAQLDTPTDAHVRMCIVDMSYMHTGKEIKPPPVSLALFFENTEFYSTLRGILCLGDVQVHEDLG